MLVSSGKIPEWIYLHPAEEAGGYFLHRPEDEDWSYREH